MELETTWHGATWRDFPQPEVGTLPDRSVAEDIREFLSMRSRPDVWHRAADIRRAIDATMVDVRDRLRGMVKSGEVERERQELWGASYWVFRMKAVPAEERRERRVRPTRAEFLAMRQRLTDRFSRAS